MTNSRVIQTVISLFLVVACLVLVDKVAGFSSLKLGYRALIDVLVILVALRFAVYATRFIDEHRKK
jgi:hypothetical protein